MLLIFCSDKDSEKILQYPFNLYWLKLVYLFRRKGHSNPSVLNADNVLSAEKADTIFLLHYILNKMQEKERNCRFDSSLSMYMSYG